MKFLFLENLGLGRALSPKFPNWRSKNRPAVYLLNVRQLGLNNRGKLWNIKIQKNINFNQKTEEPAKEKSVMERHKSSPSLIRHTFQKQN